MRPPAPLRCLTVVLHVIGIGADGWSGLALRSRILIESATTVLGSPRQLALLPDNPAQTRRAWPSPLREALPALLSEFEPNSGQVVALASGDPLLAGIGSTLIELLGPDRVVVVPALSSTTLARARMGWSAESAEVIRDPATLPRHLAPGRRILLLSTDADTPELVAKTLCENNFGDSVMTVLADLGAASEHRRSVPAHDWQGPGPALHVLAVECRGGPGLGLTAGLPDDAYEHDGQLTKRDLRAGALARLAPQPGQLLWDVGAGAGSIGIEWMRAHSSCRAVAIERSPERAARITRNAARLGVPALRVVTGAAPQALADLPHPDAVFVGGGLGVPGVLDACWEALAPGGRLVAHAVTLESEAELVRRYAVHGGELTRIGVEHAAPLGSLTAWMPARAITSWSVTKPARDHAELHAREGDTP